MDDDDMLVACQRVLNRAPEVPSVIKTCDRCKQSVYVSHETLARIERECEGKKVVYACLDCVPTYDIDVTESMRPSKEQIREIEAATGRKLSQEDIDRAMEHFKNAFRDSRSARN